MRPVAVYNRQRKLRADTKALQSFAEEAVKYCLRKQCRETGVLSKLQEVAVVLVSDRTMAKLHLQFLGISGPTDVITFDDGEIVMSVETAARQAKEWGTSLGQELRLYIVHGLLHLCGYDDRTPAGAREMAREQERLVPGIARL